MPRELDIRQLAQALNAADPDQGRTASWPLPSGEAVVDLLLRVRALLFPRLALGSDVEPGADLEALLQDFHEELSRTIERALALGDGQLGRQAAGQSTARDLSRAFIAMLPDIQAVLGADVQAAYDGDPALHSSTEAILCYPGLKALICYRVAHELHVLGVPVLPRMMTEHAHSITGIDIHPGATIGERFFIDHGTGVVIGATAVIGNRVRLYHGVTLGARSFVTGDDGKLVKDLPRHPILEDDVVVYSWASILGRITIGRRSVIGGNVWVTRDVPPDTVVTQAQASQAGFSDGGGI